MDPFFNQEYADEVYEYVAGMDDDTAQMFTLMVAHDVLHRHVDDNRQVVKSYTNEILTDIADTVISKALDRGDEDVAELVSKATERWTIDGRPVTVKRARDAGGRFARVDTRKYKTAVKTKPDGSRTLSVKYTGPADNWAMQAGKDYDVTAALMNKPGERASQFEQEWNSRQEERGSTSRTYNRIGAGSKLVSEVGLATGDHRIATAGKLGEFAGSFGPEAEKVVGPSMRRTAYRYRGTERAVDSDLKKAIRSEVALQMRDQGTVRPQLTPAQKSQLNRRANQEYKNRTDKSVSMSEIRNKLYADAQSAQRPQRAPLSPEQRIEVARAKSIEYLDSRLPSNKLSTLQRESGKLPPSEGVIINAEGHVVAQAVGYMEDHYLPFNLKNLKGLQGGTYVRTRSSGGLTSEDIYTGLMAGARSVTVTSRSGTFTVDFEDDFRGVRRYGDVARGMVDRYERTLDAVQSETIERSSLTAEEKAQIREDVETEYASMSRTAEGRRMIEEQVKEQIKEARRSTDLSPREVEEIKVAALEQAGAQDSIGRPMGGGRHERLPADPEKRYKVIYAQMMEDARAQKESRMLRLDGQGYETALKALQEQYPYFIANVRTNVYKDPENKHPKSRETDTGYVRPNYLRPKEVKDGYFDSEIEGVQGMKIGEKVTGKYSAAETNYQNYANRKNRPSKETSTGDGEGPSKTSSSSTGTATSSIEARQKAETAAKASAAVDRELNTAVVLALSKMPVEDIPSLAGLLGTDFDIRKEGAKEKLKEKIATPHGREQAYAGVKEFAASLDFMADPSSGVDETDQRRAASMRDSFQEKLKDIERNVRLSSRSSKGAALPDNFSQSPMHPAMEFPDGFKVKPEMDTDYYDTQLDRFNELRHVTGLDDSTMRGTSNSSLTLASAYEKYATSGGTDDDYEMIIRMYEEDDHLDKAEEDLVWSATSKPELAARLAKRHRKRAMDIEKIRGLRQASEDADARRMQRERTSSGGAIQGTLVPRKL